MVHQVIMKENRNYIKQIDTWAAVAQEVRSVVWQQEGCWFDTRGSA